MITEVSIQYANALFELASEEEKQEFLNNLEVATQAIIHDEEVFKVFEHPQIASSKKKEIIINVFKNKVSDVFTNFLLVIIDHKRINELNNIKDAYELILNNYLKVLDATVYSKYPLTDIQKNNLTQTLKEHYQKDIRINEIIDDSLLAGIKVVVGNEVIDGTALTKMNKLKDMLKG